MTTEQREKIRESVHKHMETVSEDKEYCTVCEKRIIRDIEVQYYFWNAGIEICEC